MADLSAIPSGITLETQNLKKTFDRRVIFRDLDLKITNGESLAITGRNGTGKSTLIKILANVLEITSGRVTLTADEKLIERGDYYKYVGFVSPYLNLYDEFTGYENLHFVTRVRGLDAGLIDPVLERVGLYDRRHDLVKIYSSGMKQRLKIAFSIIHNPPILLLDEPTSNLDSQGIGIIDQITDEYKKESLLVIATNDEHERSLCASELNLNNLPGKEVK